MPSAYVSLADAQSIPLTAITITNATNATPIVITTASAHGINEGDLVRIIEVAGNTAANGLWYAHVLSTTTLALWTPVAHADVAGNGTYTASTGEIADLNWSATTTIPSDGDDATAAAVNTPTEAMLDRSARLALNVGGSVMLAEYVTDAVSAPYGGNWLATANPSTTTYVEIGGILSALDVLPGDVVEVELTTSLSVGTLGTPTTPIVAVALFAQILDYGGSPSFGSATAIGGAEVEVASGTYGQLHLHGSLLVSGSPSRGRQVVFFVACSTDGSGSAAVNLQGSHYAIARVLRDAI